MVAARLAPAGPRSGYNVYVGTAPGHETGTPINGATPVTSTSYAVTGLTNGTRYYFEVTALNSAGEGAPSNEAGATPAAPLAAPAGVSAAAGNGQVSLSWSPPPSNGGPRSARTTSTCRRRPGPQGRRSPRCSGYDLHRHRPSKRDGLLLRGDGGRTR